MRARILSIILPVILIVGASVAVAGPAQAATGDAASVFSQTNAQRAKAGLKPLISDPALDQAAQAWAQQLANSCTFAHSTSAWRSARVAKAGWAATGENIAAGYTVAAVVPAWMASAGHKANILNAKYTGVGIGFAKGKCYSSYWVQIFGWTKTAGVAGTGDADGDFDADVLSRDAQGQLLLHRGNGVGKWQSRSVVGNGWQPADKLVTLGDFTGDGINDIARVRGGTFELMRGTGGSTFAAPAAIGTGWEGYRFVVGGIDFNGDRFTDVLGVTTNGTVVLHRGNGKGGWISGTTTVGTGWTSVTAAFYVGDFDGDSVGDIVTRRSNGNLLLHPTSGTGGWKYSKALATGWNGMTTVFSPGDFDGSGQPDIIARRSDGSGLLYRGNGKGGFGTVSVIATGWNAYNGFG